MIKDLRPQAVIDNAADMVASAVLAVEGLGGFYDLLCPSPLFAKMLFLGTSDPTHELRLHELGRVAVPGIGDLDVTDAVRIRQSSDAFALWRDQLSDALAHAHHIRQTQGADADTSTAVRELIAEARTSLHREARRSRLLNTTNPLAFVAGALGGAIAGAPGGAVGTAFGAVGGTLGPLVQAVLNTRRVPGYVDRHYLVVRAERRISLKPRPLVHPSEAPPSRQSPPDSFRTRRHPRPECSLLRRDRRTRPGVGWRA